MANSRFRAGLVLTLSFGLALAVAGEAFAAAKPHDAMTAFRSDEELLAYLKKVRRTPPPAPAPSMAMDGAVATSAAPAQKAESRQAGDDSSITNNQEAG